VKMFSRSFSKSQPLASAGAAGAVVVKAGAAVANLYHKVKAVS
jgi:hypothetical protein